MDQHELMSNLEKSELISRDQSVLVQGAEMNLSNNESETKQQEKEEQKISDDMFLNNFER